MLLPVARVGKLFGVEGGLHLSLYTTFPDDFNLEEPLFVSLDRMMVPLFCARFERSGISGALVAFDDFDTPRRAEELISHELFLERDDESDEFRLEDLIGFRLECLAPGGKKKVAAGTVTDFYDSDTNPLFEAEIDGRTLLIPIAEEFIASIDFERRRLKMVLPDGLLDL